MINSANAINTQSLSLAMLVRMLDENVCEQIVRTIFECTQLHFIILLAMFWSQRTYRVSSTVCLKKVLQTSVNQGVICLYRQAFRTIHIYPDNCKVNNSGNSWLTAFRQSTTRVVLCTLHCQCVLITIELA